jgi:hypothetical protein
VYRIILSICGYASYFMELKEFCGPVDLLGVTGYIFPSELKGDFCSEVFSTNLDFRSVYIDKGKPFFHVLQHKNNELALKLLFGNASRVISVCFEF